MGCGSEQRRERSREKAEDREDWGGSCVLALVKLMPQIEASGRQLCEASAWGASSLKMSPQGSANLMKGHANV